MSQVDSVRVRRRAETPKSTAKPVLNIVKPGGGTHLKLVLFGPPGTGKTTVAVSGSGKKLLILTEPDGDLSLIGRDDIDVVKPEGGTELVQVVQTLHEGAHQDYNWIVLDSVTFAFELMGRKLVSAALEKGVDIRRPYGQVGAAVTQVVHDLVALPNNVVFTTQLRHDYIDDEDPDEAGPEEGKFPFTLAVTPMVYKILAPAVSVRGRTYKQSYVDAKGNKVPRYMVSFEDYGKSPAGSRIPVPGKVENLNLDDLAQLLTKGA